MYYHSLFFSFSLTLTFVDFGNIIVQNIFLPQNNKEDAGEEININLDNHYEMKDFSAQKSLPSSNYTEADDLKFKSVIEQITNEFWELKIFYHLNKRKLFLGDKGGYKYDNNK